MDSARVETARLRYRISELIGKQVKLARDGRTLKGLCPFHREKSPSFDVDDRRGTFKCFGCGEQGDVFDWLMLTQSLNFKEAVNHLLGGENWLTRAIGGLRPVTILDNSLDGAEEDRRRIKYAHALWLKRERIEETLAESYLRGARGVTGPIPAVLGYVHQVYCSDVKDELPALIAPLQDRHGHVTAVQRIYLDRETHDAWRGADGRRLKRTLGIMRDGCVRLGVPDKVMGIAGSVEDALAGHQLFSIPAWATCGEERMADVWIPPEVQTLVIFADADDVGQRCAREAKRAHSTRGLYVEIATPESGKDWASKLEQPTAA